MNDVLELTLSHGEFVVLMSATGVQCSYTDYASTSRFGTCSPAELVAFATAVLTWYAQTGD